MTEDVIPNNNIKLCECGCGRQTTIYLGQPRRFISGHNPIDYSKRNTPRRENKPNWKGGIRKARKYLKILRHYHKYADRWGYIPLHRYRMELIIGRYLTPEERVHHIDGNPSNNEEDNLMLFSNNSEHITYERTKDMSGRKCKICNSSKTRIKIRNKKRYSEWYGNDKDGFTCFKCYKRESYQKKKKGGVRRLVSAVVIPLIRSAQPQQSRE